MRKGENSIPLIIALFTLQVVTTYIYIAIHIKLLTGVPEFADLNVSVSASTSAGQGPFSEPVIIHITTGGMPLSVNYAFNVI